MNKILFTLEEASQMVGLSKSTLYKLTSKNTISFYKPFGKKIFFSQEQLEGMMKKVLVPSTDELITHQLNQKGGVKGR